MKAIFPETARKEKSVGFFLQTDWMTMYGSTAIPRGRRSSLTSSPAGVPAVRLFRSYSSNLCIYNLKDCNIFYGRIGIKTA